MGWFIPFFLVFGSVMVSSLTLGKQYTSIWPVARFIFAGSFIILGGAGIWMAIDSMRLIHSWKRDDLAKHGKHEL